MNTQRRIFRGRGGPTDGRLPKHNARRRRQPGANARKPAVNKYAEDDGGDEQQQQQQHLQYMEDEVVLSSSNSEYDNDKSSTDDEMEEDAGKDDNDVTSTTLAANRTHQQPYSTTTTTSNTRSSSPVEASAPPPPWLPEIQHLKRRVKNVQESIQTSEGITNPATYQANVLHAVENCIKEWRSILKFYNKSTTAEEDTTTTTTTTTTNTTTQSTSTMIDPETRKHTALTVYVLLQHSMQCGPLEGGKPGYFKRCGGPVAKMVLDFLNRVVPTDATSNSRMMDQDNRHCTAIEELGFSPKQAEAIATWKSNAAKAVQADKPPSKSALKKQEGKSKTKKLKKGK